VDPRIAARAMVAVLVAVAVAVASLWQTPTYEASAVLLVAQKEQSDGKIQPIPNYHPHRLGGHQALAQVMAIAVETAPWPRRLSDAWGWRCSRANS
jgi:hypothetical protein